MVFITITGEFPTDDFNYVRQHDRLDDAIQYCFDEARRTFERMWSKISEKEYAHEIERILHGLKNDQKKFVSQGNILNEPIVYDMDGFTFKAIIKFI